MTSSTVWLGLCTQVIFPVGARTRRNEHRGPTECPFSDDAGAAAKPPGRRRRALPLGGTREGAAIPPPLVPSRVAMASGAPHDCRSSSNRAASGRSIRCAETTPFPSRRLTSRALLVVHAGICSGSAATTASTRRAQRCLTRSYSPGAVCPRSPALWGWRFRPASGRRGLPPRLPSGSRSRSVPT